MSNYGTGKDSRGSKCIRALVNQFFYILSRNVRRFKVISEIESHNHMCFCLKD